MRRPRVLMVCAAWVCAGLCAGLACDGDTVELPRDAARPLVPAAVPVVAELVAAAHAATDLPADAHEESGGSELPADVTRAPSRYVRRTVTPQLRGKALAHRVYQARFGPSAATGEPTAVVLTRSSRPGEPARVDGFALSGSARFEFPSLHDGGGDGDAALDRIAAVMFRYVDRDPDHEVIILIAYQDEDPQASPYFSNVVLDWDTTEGRFVRLERLEGEIEAFGTAGEVTAHLRRISPP